MSKTLTTAAILLFTNLGVGAGTEVVADELSKEFSSNGYFDEIHIIQTNHMGFSDNKKRISSQKKGEIYLDYIKSPLEWRVIKKLLRTKPLQVAFGDIIYTAIYALFNIRKIKKLTKKLDFLICLNHSDAWVWLLFKNKKTSFVISSDRGLPDSGIQKKLLQKYADTTHYLTSAQMNKYRINTRDKFIAPNGVRSDLFLPDNINHDEAKKRFLFAGRLEEGKGLLELIETINQLDNENWIEFFVAGTGTFEGTLKSMKNNILNFVGYVKREELVRLFKTSDIFVFPSKGEPFGNVVIEAVSSGLFVLASNALRGNFDDLEELGALKYVDISPENLKEEFLSLKDFKLSQEKKQEFHKYIVDNYDWSAIARRWYEGLVKIT